MQVQQLMTQPIHMCSSNATLDSAARIMWDRDVGAIAVVDTDGKLVGIITDRDICMAGYTQGRTLSDIPVQTAMATNVFSAQPEDTIEHAEFLMKEHQIRRVPVVDASGKPIGMLTVNDLAREAARTGKKDVSRRTAETMAAICRPRGALLEPEELSEAPLLQARA